MANILTDVKVKSTKPDGTALPHVGVKGLVFHPSSAKGCGKWVLRFTSPVTGKRRIYWAR